MSPTIMRSAGVMPEFGEGVRGTVATSVAWGGVVAGGSGAADWAEELPAVGLGALVPLRARDPLEMVAADAV